ncbi:MAG: ornithine carbamoyltransferase [Gammaproteobacteria bacterium]
MKVRHFLSLLDLSPEACTHVIERAIALKRLHAEGKCSQTLHHKVLGMIFEKSSTRTRVSFESAMLQCGGGAIFLTPQDSQLGRGEPIEDTARVLSRMVDIVVIRTFSHDRITRFASQASVPVINALTDDFHPCQLLADMQTFREHRGPITGANVTWVGDGNNMCNSYINAARQFDFQLNIVCPEGFDPNAELLAANQDRVTCFRDPAEAIRKAHLVVTDVWASMGQEAESQHRFKAFSALQVTPKLMDLAAPKALFMHCLPAHRGEEISHDMLDDPRSVVWDEAENRLHAQKALVEFLLLQTNQDS